MASAAAIENAGSVEPIHIRGAHPRDGATISALIRSVAHYFTLRPDGAGAEEFLKGISPGAIRSYASAPQFLYLVAAVGTRLAGVAALRDNTHLYHLFVAAPFQRRGVARALWGELLNRAARRGNPGNFTVNATPFAVPVYQSFGFATAGERVETNGIATIPMRRAPGLARRT